MPRLHTAAVVATDVHVDGGDRLTVAGLFAGIGGIELGLHAAGHETLLLCEIDAGASAVLREHFENVPLVGDILELDELPPVDLVAAGFPCQDLSQAGRTAGIGGRNSGLVARVFELVRRMSAPPRWLLLENVPFMLRLDRGRAMTFLTSSLGRLGFRWAYRVVDTRSFGLPQRRQRVILFASATDDPRRVLFADDAGERTFERDDSTACGFYWTEGVRGLGWAVDAIPTLKGGSTVGIPSPPAIWLPEEDRIVVPGIRDAERLQGFDPDWTLPAQPPRRRNAGPRWKLVGNAVSVPVAAWVGERLARPGLYDERLTGNKLQDGDRWPLAAWGEENRAYEVSVSMFPRHDPYQHLARFLDFDELTDLSARATAGFYERTKRSSLRFEPAFLEAIERHLERMSRQEELMAVA